jgi:hypothetical protein
MATYPLQGPAHAGAGITLQAPGGTVGDLCPTGQGVGLLVSNASTGGSMTVVLPVTPTYDSLAVSNRVVTCAGGTGATDGLTIIPVPDSVYGVGTTAVQFSTVTNISVAAIRIP